MRNLLDWLLRTAAAALTLLSGALLIYGFGAGYFSPISLPNPWNVVGTAVGGGLLLFAVAKILARPR